MKVSLGIRATGAISPGGNKIEALLDPSSWKRSDRTRLLPNTPPTSVMSVEPVLLNDWRRESRFRRATPLSLFLAESIAPTMNQVEDRSRLGLIVITFTGSITYSRKFYQEIVEQSPRAASPMMFPETVFNSPASHAASYFKIGGPVYSLLGDESAWISGLETAALWLQLKKADQVLVVAAYEMDDMSIEAYHAAGWIRKGLIPSEGAGALLLQTPDDHTTFQISSLQQGFLHRTRSDFNTHRKALLENSNIHLHPLSWNPWTQSRQSTSTPHAFCATAAWQTICALQKEKDVTIPILGCNHQSGLIQLKVNQKNIKLSNFESL